MSSTSFTSCNKDDDNENNPLYLQLIGTWVYTKKGSYINTEYVYIFKSDGKYSWSALGVVLEEGKFELKGNYVYCTPNNDLNAPSVLDFTGGQYLYDAELDIEYEKKS